jgi:hypothetical protein
MKRLMIAALLASAFAIGGTAHAACSGTAISAGVSDVFHTTVSGIELDIRVMGAPYSVGQPPVTAVGACTDGTAGPVREMHILITDTASSQTLCDRWLPYDAGSYDPFGGGVLLGAGILMQQDGDHPCGVNATWDPVGYAAGVALNGYDATRLRFADQESDAYGSSAGLGIGADFTGAGGAKEGVIWWPAGSVSGTDTSHTWYARGVGAANYAP